uniref:RING-type E3 ubiquitin transferase n=1 Tax=Kalanchoe fedtschenkoi TaxID=63787 RepID=A0A7N0TSW0_KALFE
MADPHEAGDSDKRLPHPPSSSAPKLGFNNSTQNQQQQPFDSSMCLTILVLLAALFFMGFFSIYIRRFAHDSPVEISRRRRLRSPSPSSSSYTLAAASPAATRLCGARKGLDFTTIQSLPVLAYSSGFGKHPLVVDCPVCLTEFEEGEGVKMLPSCQHLFHPECIDTWLLSRASCPVCRASRIFAAAEQEERVGGEVAMEMEAAADGGDGGVVAGAEDEMMRRCCSCSNLLVSVRGGLERTRSI